LRAGIVDGGWRDTVLVLPGETVRVHVPFTRHPGLYLYHCHILEHEDMGMMRNFRVT
jgi:FtsP/CotA-like multicopper oxidase with cupredoxin domain